MLRNYVTDDDHDNNDINDDGDDNFSTPPLEQRMFLSYNLKYVLIK
jgi:hypothetical protein